jgi:hypothetical protein
MTADPFYLSRSSVTKIDGVHRRASLESGATVDFGVHGAIKEHYGIHSAPDLPLPVDYLVAAAAA